MKNVSLLLAAHCVVNQTAIDSTLRWFAFCSASPQVLSMLGNSYPSGGGPLSQNHVQSMNNFSSMGMFNEMNSNDGAPFDINDFPQLNSRPNSSGGPQGQIGNNQSGYFPVQQPEAHPVLC